MRNTVTFDFFFLLSSTAAAILADKVINFWKILNEVNIG